MTGTMFLQMKLQPVAPNMDPTQQAIMKYMPLMFVVFFYSCLIRPLPLLDRAKRVVHHPNQDDQGGS